MVPRRRSIILDTCMWLCLTRHDSLFFCLAFKARRSSQSGVGCLWDWMLSGLILAIIDTHRSHQYLFYSIRYMS